MEAPEEQRKKRRVGAGAPCESRKTVTLILFYVFFLYSLVNRRTLQVVLVHLIDVPITSREADRGCASAKDPGGNRGACRLQASGDSTGGREVVGGRRGGIVAALHGEQDVPTSHARDLVRHGLRRSSFRAVDTAFFARPWHTSSPITTSWFGIRLRSRQTARTT